MTGASSTTRWSFATSLTLIQTIREVTLTRRMISTEGMVAQVPFPYETAAEVVPKSSESLDLAPHYTSRTHPKVSSTVNMYQHSLYHA